MAKIKKRPSMAALSEKNAHIRGRFSLQCSKILRRMRRWFFMGPQERPLLASAPFPASQGKGSKELPTWNPSPAAPCGEISAGLPMFAA
jgi:hypothetical protein